MDAPNAKVPGLKQRVSTAVRWFLASDRRLFVLALAGAIAYGASGYFYRVNWVDCGNRPSFSTGLVSGITYLLALSLMTAAWLGFDVFRQRTSDGAAIHFSFRTSLIAALAVHLVVALVPPFLSQDTLAYGAIGSAMANHDQSMYMPLGMSLPAADPYAIKIAAHSAWLAHGSTYGPLFNYLAAAVVYVAGDNVTMALRLFQAVSLIAIFGAALFAADAARTWQQKRLSEAGDVPNEADVATRVLRLVLFCPLALIEATGNGHNDAILALFAAAAAWLIVKPRFGLALGVLIGAVLIKASAVFLPALFILHRLALRVRDHRTVILTGIGLGLCVVAAVWFGWPLIEHSASTIIRMIGTVDDIYPFCTRSLECFPRALLHIVLDMPWASWSVGLVFRILGVGLLIVIAWRSATAGTFLAAAATFLLFYYLFLHAYMQAWYLLSLLVLLYFIGDRLMLVAKVFIISSLAQYALDFSLACAKEPLWAGLREAIGFVIVLLPPSLVLARQFWFPPRSKQPNQ